MRMTAFVVCVPLVAGALAAQTTTNDPIQGKGGQGVTLMLLPPSPETHQPLRYVLSEPAYVAAFLVYPGAGVRLLYPLVNQPERLHGAGYNTDELLGASFDNDIYNVVLGPLAQGQGPVYLYMVASRHPLDVARYVHRPMTLASAVGEKESRSFYSDVAFDALLDNAVSLGNDESWDSDMYILWPSVDGTRAHAHSPLARVLCADGTARDVPINYPFTGCPGQQHIRPATLGDRVVQKSALAEAQAPQRDTRTAAMSRSFANSPTVLPTIIGDRAAAARERAERARDRESQGTIVTAANGEQSEATSSGATNTQIELFDGSRRNRARRGDNDGARTRFSPEERQQWRQQHQDEHVGGSPSLSPNPRLSPNPQLPPNPGMREPQRSAPRYAPPRYAPPRYEAPRTMGSSPPPMRSAPAARQLGAPDKGASGAPAAKQDH